MKRLVTMLLATLMCLSLGLFVACSGVGGHEHTFSSEWSKDANGHYHACTQDGCAVKSDVQAHQWDTGVEIEGYMVYTCSVCEYSRKEVIPHTYNVDSSEWAAALSLDENSYNNYVIETVNRSDGEERTQTVEFNNGKVKITAQVDSVQTVAYIYNEGAMFYSVNSDGKYWRQQEVGASSYNNARTLGIDSMFDYSDFTFDGTKYSATTIQVPGAPMSYDNVNIYFEDCKVIKIEFTFTVEDQTSQAIINYTYGNANEITIPEIKPDTEVTSTEWHGAFMEIKGWSYFTYELEITENDETESYKAKVIGGHRMELDFGEEYNVYYQKEVYDYYKYTNVNGKWKKTKVESQEFSKFENYVVYMYGTMLEFDQFEYNEEESVYKYIGEVGEGFEGSGATVTFLDNRIKNINIKMVHGQDAIEIDCDYVIDESINVEIPKLDTTVTAQEWVTALALNCNYEMKETSEYNNQNYTATLTKKDGNFCYEINNNKVYHEEKNGRYFEYSFDADKNGYLRKEISYDEFTSATDYFSVLSSSYNLFTYDKTKEAYVYEKEGDIFHIYMLDDRLIKVESEFADGETSVFTIDYESVTDFTLPEYIDLSAVTATDWVGAFNIDAQANYTLTWKETTGTVEDIIVYTKDGDVLRMVSGDDTEYFAKADGAEYHFYMQDDEWKKEESQSENGWSDQTSTIVSMPETIAFNEMEYDVDDCEYFAQTVANVPAFKDITFKFFEGKIVYMSISAANEDAKIEITIQYVGEELELPDVYDATAVTSEQFYKAIDLPALVLGNNPQNFVFNLYEYGIVGKTETLSSTTTVTFNGTTFYKEYVDERNPDYNSYYIWHKVPDEEIEDDYNDPRYLYFYNESGTWNRRVYSRAKSNWTQGTKEYKEFIKFLFVDLLVVPGQQFNQDDVWTNDYSFSREATYEDFTYDSVNGCYHADKVSDYKFNVNMYFENQMLMRYSSESAPSRYDNSVVKYVYEIVYSSDPIELPTEYTDKN